MGLASEFPSGFSACVVTQVQACKFGKTIDISDIFLAAEGSAKGETICPILSRCPLVVVLKQN